MQFIDLKTQYACYHDEIDARMAKVLEHGRFIMGPEISELETALANYVDVSHAITTGSGTVSLEIALRALGIGPGDEVITVPFTWISTAETIAAVGATPVFVDIQADTFNMDPELLSAAITGNTKAIMPVSLFGQMADYQAINSIAAEYEIPVIEDGAQSFGASANGYRSCGVTSIASTSFFPAKPLGCYGDGGALFTNNDELAMRMRAIRTHGGEKRHHHPYIGVNGRMDTLQAAVVLAKLPHYTAEVAARAEIGERYGKLIAERCGNKVTVPAVAPGNTSVWAQYTIRVDDRSRVAGALKEAGIPTAIYYPKCLHEQPVFASLNYPREVFQNSITASESVLSLPMHPFLSVDDQDRIVDALAEATVGVTPSSHSK